MSSIYCHKAGCERTCRGERDAQGIPLCDQHKAREQQDDLINAAKMLSLAFPPKKGAR